MTQTARLIAYLRSHPGATSLQITHALALVNVTGRVSDARAQGIDIECVRDGGLARYFVREHAPLSGTQEALTW
jgi:hypothetical protein